MTLYQCPRDDLRCRAEFATTGDLDHHFRWAHGYRRSSRLAASLGRERRLPYGPKPSRRLPSGVESSARLGLGVGSDAGVRSARGPAVDEPAARAAGLDHGERSGGFGPAATVAATRRRPWDRMRAGAGGADSAGGARGAAWGDRRRRRSAD
jgi:hypothetical protein